MRAIGHLPGSSAPGWFGSQKMRVRALGGQRIADGRWQSIGALRELFRHGAIFAEPCPASPRRNDQFGEWLQTRQ
jgi:hypothetical protein